MDANDIAAYKEQVFDQSSTHTPTSTATPDNADTTKVDTVIDTTLDTKVDDKPIDNTTVIDTTKVDAKVDAPDYLKELGFENLDAAKQSIQELRTKAETPAEHKFANDQSKALYELIAAGKNSEVRQFLDVQDKLSKVAEMSAADALKLHIEQTNKHYTSDDVKDVFDEKYSKPSEPKQGDDELDEAFAARTAQYKETVAKIDRRIERDAKEAKESLAQLATKLELPTIQKPEDVEYQNWKQFDATQKQLMESEKQAYTKFTPKDINLNFKFEDKARKLAFDVNYNPDEKGFSKAVEEAGDLQKFFANFREDGSPQRDKFLKAVYVADNIDKIVGEAIKQAVNETTKDFLAKQKNVGNEMRRDFNTTLEKSDIDKLRETVFS